MNGIGRDGWIMERKKRQRNRERKKVNREKEKERLVKYKK